MRTLELPGDEKLEIKTTLERDLFGKTPPATVRRLNAMILAGVDSGMVYGLKLDRLAENTARISTIQFIQPFALENMGYYKEFIYFSRSPRW